MPLLEWCFRFVAQVSMRLIVIGGWISSTMAMVFLFRSRDSSFVQKKCGPTPSNKVIVGFCSAERILRTWEQALFFFIIETRTFVVWKLHTLFVPTWRSVHISNNISDRFFCSLQKYRQLGHTSKKSNDCLIKWNITHLTHGLGLNTHTDNHFFQQSEKSFCEHKNSQNAFRSDNTR